MIVGADTGGTFTDVVTDTGTVGKVLSTPGDPGRAAADGVQSVAPGPVSLLSHGTTVATNALLERRGARVALVTTRGMADVVEIARQDRPSLYDPFADRPPALVPRHLRVEVGGRLDASGQEIAPIDLADLDAVPGDVEAVAVCLLHADLNDDHERAVEEALARRGFDVSRSSAVSPEFREYERTLTTVANAMLRPVAGAYLARIRALASDVLVMTSAGGLLPAHEAALLPVSLLLSGPAAGVQAGAAAAAAAGFAGAVTFDMGGTSTDVCLVVDGRAEPAPALEVGGYPIRMPSLDIHTIGAGGGSIARLDPGGALAVGPQSAGADPGPVCYGRGGDAPTVTDADLLLGRIPADTPLPQLGRLDTAAAEKAFQRSAIDPAGVVAVVDAAMEQAVRRVSVERGVDARDLALVAFGGAGPLHACAVADRLGMRAVVVPPRAGVLSAVGLLTSPRRRELVRSWPTPGDHDGLPEARRALEREVATLAGPGATVESLLDCRYAGQSHELPAVTLDHFHDVHARRNGFSRPEARVEVVALRARAVQPAPVDTGSLPAVDRRAAAVGPTVLAEPDCTVFVADGWRADLHDTGAWVLTRSA